MSVSGRSILPLRHVEMVGDAVVGLREGAFDGSFVGARVGRRVGAFVGRRVGAFVGTREGRRVGAFVGVRVGDRVVGTHLVGMLVPYKESQSLATEKADTATRFVGECPLLHSLQTMRYVTLVVKNPLEKYSQMRYLEHVS